MRQPSRVRTTLPFGGSWAALLLLTSCVTINIYFPAAAAEKAADRIIEQVWGDEKPQQDKPENRSDLRLGPSLLVSLLDWVIAPAHAEMDFSVETPLIRKIVASMNQRHTELLPHYASGALGLTPTALVTVRDIKQVALPERSRLNKLVGEENHDRASLYAAIAAANGHPEWEEQVRQTFARRWIDKAQRGWWYQDPQGNWRQK